MKKLVLKNEELIEKFDLNYYLSNKKYSIAAAVSALETANEIQKSYFKCEDNLDEGDNILRLYALLQGLFVSIDSLYSLAYGLTKSKNFININHNQCLRELKYIRNDVVGHPANRTYDSNEIAYCILDKHSISKEGFSYFIYSQDEVIKKDISINEIVSAYYLECNRYLSTVHKQAIICQNEEELINMVLDIFDVYLMNGNFMEKVLELKKVYNLKYPETNGVLHRVLWRIDLIEKLYNYNSMDKDILELANYAIGVEIVKILELYSCLKHKVELAKRTPYLVSSFYRFLNKNRKMIELVEKISDIKNPLFNSSMTELLNFTKKNNLKGPYKYLSFLNKLYLKNDDSLVYAFALPLKEYKKK